jgi:hypothetical protein
MNATQVNDGEERARSRYSSFHTFQYDFWPVCNGGNPRALLECTHSDNQEHEPTRMHNLLLGEFRCPVCSRESHYSVFKDSRP